MDLLEGHICNLVVLKMPVSHQEETAVVEPVPVYSVNPDRITIAPKSSCQLEFFGFSAQPGQNEERFICTLGSGVKSKQTVFDIVARSDIQLHSFEQQSTQQSQQF